MAYADEKIQGTLDAVFNDYDINNKGYLLISEIEKFLNDIYYSHM